MSPEMHLPKGAGNTARDTEGENVELRTHRSFDDAMNMLAGKGFTGEVRKAIAEGARQLAEAEGAHYVTAEHIQLAIERGHAITGTQAYRARYRKILRKNL